MKKKIKLFSKRLKLKKHTLTRIENKPKKLIRIKIKKYKFAWTKNQ